tara:strand:- start:270 stop:773 length:504 start_codon:yes stop_codon:yes gene_type:complete
MKKFNEIRQTILPEAYKQVEVDWDQDRPDRELAGDIKADFGVYIDGYSKKKGTLKVTGSEKELMNWITDTDELGLGFDKRTAQGIIKKGKNVKESVDEALGNTNPSHREKPKMDKDGTVHNIPGKKGGLSAYSIKPRIDGNTITFGTVDQEGNIKVMSVKELAKVLK